jgi:hypothetical protein
MNKIFLLFLMSISLSATAQQLTEFNDVNAKIRPLSDAFTQVSVSSGVELYLNQGDETALAISVSDNKYEDRFKTTVVNGVLKIYYDQKGMSWTNDKNSKLKAYLSFKTIDKIIGEAGAKVVLTNELKLPLLSMDFSSGAQITGLLNVTSLQVVAGSGSNINCSGKADKVDISVNSGASFKGYDLQSQYCTAHANSGATVKIAVQKELAATVNSGGSISYGGNPTLIKRNMKSGGTIKKANK